VPATSFVFGYRPSTKSERIYRHWYEVGYHRPQDDLDQPIDWKEAADFNAFFYALVDRVTDGDKGRNGSRGASSNYNKERDMRLGLASVAAVALLAGRAAATDYKATPIMGIAGPEDLELLPDGQTLVVGQFRRPPVPGGLSLLDTSTGTSLPLPITDSPAAGWGEPGCTAPKHIGAHGIHLSKRSDGRWQLLAVNHEDRESLEFLELVGSGRATRAIWHGCVISSDGAYNDVAATPDGGFVATIPTDAKVFAANGGKAPMDGKSDTGYLVAWRPGKGQVRLPGSDAPYNNGIQLSPDGKVAFFNAWTAKEVRRYDIAAGKVTGTIRLAFRPDNLTWSRDGTLVAAGTDEASGGASCPQIDGMCALGFGIARIDLKTFRATPVYTAPAGVMVGVSVAIEVGRDFYVGGFSGNRIVKLTPQ